MKLVLDASVAVAAARPHEIRHIDATRCVRRVLTGQDTMLVPSIFRVEVASALTRAGVDAALTRRYLENLLSMAEVVTLGPVRTRQVQEIAMRTRLRAADAIYVWLAARENLTLVTLDQEMLARSAGLCTVAAP